MWHHDIMLCYITSWCYDVIKMSNSYCSTGQFLKKVLVEYIGVFTDTNNHIVQSYVVWLLLPEWSRFKEIKEMRKYTKLVELINWDRKTTVFVRFQYLIYWWKEIDHWLKHKVIMSMPCWCLYRHLCILPAIFLRNWPVQQYESLIFMTS